LSLTTPRKHTGEEEEARLHSFLTSTPVRVGQLHALADLSQGKELWHQLNRRLGWLPLPPALLWILHKLSRALYAHVSFKDPNVMTLMSLPPHKLACAICYHGVMKILA